MCKWKDKTIGKKTIPAEAFEAICNIILESAKQRNPITYKEITEEIKKKQFNNIIISRKELGYILGEINNQVAEKTHNLLGKSIYPTAIVVKTGTRTPSTGFWGVNSGDNPPSKKVITDKKEQRKVLEEYQCDVFDISKWDCNCQ